MSSNFFECVPIINDAVCAVGQKCFHEIHILTEDRLGNPIPPDACPINCVVDNVEIRETVRIGECFRVSGCYRVRVWFEFDRCHPTSCDVRVAEKEFHFTVSVPVDQQFPCFNCETKSFHVRTLTFDCIKAELVFKRGFPGISVTVEKLFFVCEIGNAIVCIPACSIEECIEDLPPVIGDICIPFERPAKCDEFCLDTDLDPDNCAQCPPPQVG